MDVIFGKKDAPGELGRDPTQTRQANAGTPPPTTATRVLDILFGRKGTPDEIDRDSGADRTQDDQP